MVSKTALLFGLLCIFLKPMAQHLPYTKYTSKDGLISDRITAISQDDKGFMWFGSFFGISLYDGISFRKIELPVNQANKYVNFITTANGKTYAGFLFSGGLMEYSQGKTRSYYIGGKDSASSNEFTCLYHTGDDNLVLANTAGQVYHFKQGVFQLIYQLPLRPAVSPRYVLQDASQTIWIGTESGLFLLPKPYKKVRQYFAGENIFSMVKSNNGKIMFCRTNGITTVVHSAPVAPEGKLSDTNTIYQGRNFKMLPFTGNADKGIWGVDFIKGLTNIQETGTGHFGLPLDLNTDISAIYADRENNIWIANEPGVVKVSNFNVQTYLFNEIAAGGGNLHIVNDSVLWASNSKELYTIAGGDIRKKELKPSYPFYYGLVHMDRENNLWIGFWHEGLLKTKWENENLKSVKDLSNYNDRKVKATAIAEDTKGNIWVAGPNGIYHIRENRVVGNFHPKNSAGQPSFISCMALDESTQTLWLGDNALGVIEVKYKSMPDGTLQYSTGRFISTKQGLRDMYIRSLLVDHKQNLWIGTRSGGIFRMSTSNTSKIEDFNAASGITCTRVTDIGAEGKNALWFATCNGIYRYQHQNGKWTHYTTGDGLLNAEIFNLEADEKNQVIWALSAQGITRLKIGSGLVTVPPLVNITSINILGRPDTAAFNNNDKAHFSYSRNSIGFEFAGASFIDEKSIRYRYMLEGYNQEWSMPVYTNSVNYASLAPGSYTFKVMAANARGQWSVPASYEFEIVRPFYKSPWFIFLSITAALFLLYLARIQRLKQRFKIEKLRLNIARDLHDDIGSTLGSINILSKTAARKLDTDPSPENIAPLFRKIGDSAETTMEAMDDIVWSINPDKDKFSDIVVRMREFAIPLLEAAQIHFHFDIAGNDHLSLPMNLRRNAFLVFKEAIHNVLKHSGAERVTISMKVNHQFILEISDDGKGFSPETPSVRNGLKNMKNRAAAVGGAVDIDTREKGTTIKFMAPLR